jgi:hypothetical protein
MLIKGTKFLQNMIRTYHPYIESLNEIEQRVRENFPNRDVHLDDGLNLTEDYFLPIITGEKNNIVLFCPEKIRTPTGNCNTLRCFANYPEYDGFREERGIMRLSNVIISSVEEFPEHLLLEAGYIDEEGNADKEEMIEDLSLRYTHQVKPEDMVSQYFWTKFWIKGSQKTS